MPVGQSSLAGSPPAHAPQRCSATEVDSTALPPRTSMLAQPRGHVRPWAPRRLRRVLCVGTALGSGAAAAAVGGLSLHPSGTLLGRASSPPLAPLLTAGRPKGVASEQQRRQCPPRLEGRGTNPDTATPSRAGLGEGRRGTQKAEIKTTAERDASQAKLRARFCLLYPLACPPPPLHFSPVGTVRRGSTGVLARPPCRDEAGDDFM